MFTKSRNEVFDKISYYKKHSTVRISFIFDAMLYETSLFAVKNRTTHNYPSISDINELFYI